MACPFELVYVFNENSLTGFLSFTWVVLFLRGNYTADELELLLLEEEQFSLVTKWDLEPNRVEKFWSPLKLPCLELLAPMKDEPIKVNINNCNEGEEIIWTFLIRNKGWILSYEGTFGQINKRWIPWIRRWIARACWESTVSLCLSWQIKVICYLTQSYL